MDPNPELSVQEEHRLIFRRRLPYRVSLKELLRAIGGVEGQTCLEVGSENGVFSQQLRKHGGAWSTVAADEASAEALKAVLGEGVPVMTETVLPFKKKLFDVILVNGYLERLANADAFIEECHRCLKPDGRFIVHAVRVGGWSPVLALRRMLGPARERAKFVRAGYSETDVFNVLKHGFDVVQVRTYSRFFSELTDAIVQKLDERIRSGVPAVPATRLRRLYAVACFFYWISDQLDMLLVMSRGYKLVAIGKRRAWRPRNAPVLVDGRSISEAVLSKAGN